MRIITLIIILTFSATFTNAGTVIVTNTNNTGTGSLRNAISSASAGDTIRFSPSLIAGGNDTIKLLTEINITKNLVIKGIYTSTDTLFISGQKLTRIFNAVITSSNKNLLLDSMMLINGKSAVFQICRLTVKNSFFKNNFYGGAISESYSSNYGTVVINSSFINNIQGAIFTHSINVSNSLFIGNRLSNSGGAIKSRHGVIDSNNLFLNNYAGAISCKNFISTNSIYRGNIGVYGGAVNCSSGKVNGSKFYNNTATYRGGAIEANIIGGMSKLKLNNCIFQKNKAKHSGGAVYIYGDTLIANNTIFYGNSTYYRYNSSGGAVYYAVKTGAIGYAEFTNCAVNNNKGKYGSLNFGSSGSPSTVVINKTSFSHNKNVLICGNYRDTTELKINESTFYNNSGQIITLNNTYGTSLLNIANSTIYSNLASNTILIGGDTNSILSLKSNIITSKIVAQNAATVNSLGYNIFYDTGYVWADSTDKLGKDSTDINLGVFQNNGGFGYTVMPNIPSIAIDSGNIADSSDAQNRPIKGRRDVGAAEYSCQYHFMPDSANTCNTYYSWQGNRYDSTDTYRVIKLDSICDTVNTLSLIRESHFDTITITSCNPLFSPYSGKLYSLSGIYSDTTPKDALGCDSIILLTVNINRTFDTVQITRCNDYPSPYSSKIFYTSGIHFDTTNNSAGCDSIILINLTLNRMYDTVIINRCDSFISLSGTIYYANVTYNDTVMNRFGCDSIINMSLVFNNYHTVYENVHLCGYSQYSSSASFRLPSGGYITISGPRTVHDTINYISSCDTIYTFSFTFSKNARINRSVTTCSTYVLPSGRAISSSGVFYDTIPAPNGCDSIFRYYINYNSHLRLLYATSCNQFTSPFSGIIYDTSGIYNDKIIVTPGACDTLIGYVITLNKTYGSKLVAQCGTYIPPSGSGTFYRDSIFKDTIVNSAGCDSIITITLDIDNTIYGNGIVRTYGVNLKSTVNSATSYQWLNCGNGYSLISGETNQTMIATSNGSYAVEVVKGSCKDTSLCKSVYSVGLVENTLSNFDIYPNPNKGLFNIDLGKEYPKISVTITDVSGKLIQKKTFERKQKLEIEIKESPGIYLLQITTEDKTGRFKIIKE